MILTSHAIIGTVAASAFPSHPLLAFSVALTSHYVVDAIPHWEYNLLSSKKDLENPLNNDIAIGKDFLSDFKKVLIDMILGVIASFSVFYSLGLGNSLLILIVGILGGIAPDFLQFVYYRFRHDPFRSFYIFHHRIHSRIEWFEERYAVGIFLQILIIVTVISVRIFFGKW